MTRYPDVNHARAQQLPAEHISRGPARADYPPPHYDVIKSSATASTPSPLIHSIFCSLSLPLLLGRIACM